MRAFVLILGILLTRAGVGEHSPAGTQRVIDRGCADVSGRSDRFLKSYERLGRFSGSVSVVRDGKVLFRKGFGGNLAETKYRIGSVTKQFTAVAVLQLKEQGKLRLDDPISKWLPGLRLRYPITIRQLLSHTSGLPEFLSFDEYEDILKAHDPQSAFQRVLEKKPFDFKPGLRYEYSNSNYTLLGAILEKASGVPWDAYVKKNLLDRAGMTGSGLFTPKHPPDGIAEGYVLDSDGKLEEKTQGPDHSVLPADGALYSTVDDLQRWNTALHSGKIISASSLKEMRTPTAHSERYGLGIFADDENGQRVYFHSGEVDGFVSYVSYYPDDKTSIVVLSNNESTKVDRIGTDLASILACRRVFAPVQRYEGTPVRVGILRKYVGTYRFGDTTATVKLRRGNLYMRYADDTEFRLFPESSRKFFSKIDDDYVIFGANGYVSHYNGNTARAEKIGIRF